MPVGGAPAGEAGGDSAAETAAALLVARLPDAASGVELRTDEIVFWVPRERGAEAIQAARDAVAELAAAGQPLDPARVEARAAAPEADWRDAWKRYFRTTRLTRQIVVVPSWDSHEPGPDDRVIHLDPGQAFGTGAHASTRLVLRLMQELADGGERPARVLDLGTGSGILALAARALWPAASITAVDSDPDAVAVARENADANGAALDLSTASLDEIEPRFDLALANIQADVLSSLADQLVAKVDGWLILSGLLTEQARPIADQYCARGLSLGRVVVSDDDPAWSAVLLRCSAS